uniref:Uncharacterized protein n=1 Tax=Megaselia scalaris TaxID=36166 RepID=T1GY22_MEGSC
MNHFDIPSKVMEYGKLEPVPMFTIISDIGTGCQIPYFVLWNSTYKGDVLHTNLWNRHDHEGDQLSDIQHDQREEIQSDIEICGRHMS